MTSRTHSWENITCSHAKCSTTQPASVISL